MSEDMNVGANAAQLVTSIVERIERLTEEKQALTEDISEVYKEARGHGLDTKMIRKVIALRKLSDAERQEQEAILNLYMNALGMLSDLPLGRAAIERTFGRADP